MPDGQVQPSTHHPHGKTFLLDEIGVLRAVLRLCVVCYLHLLVMISPSFYSDTLETARPVVDGVNRTNTANPETVHDADLVKRFAAGDEGAFAEITLRYRGKMFA